jgi:hypothetical protein
MAATNGRGESPSPRTTIVPTGLSEAFRGIARTVELGLEGVLPGGEGDLLS